MNNCNEILSASSRDAILCVSPFDDLFKYYADKQFTKDSLEKVSMYVPDLSLLLKGDILTCTVNNRDVVGVITSVPAVSETKFGSDQSEDLNAVEFVWISTTKAEKTNWKDFSAAQKPKNVVFRRLLKYDGASTVAYTCAEWNVLDDMPYSARITIGKMREQDQKSAEQWRWIPNTGEYLVLEEISMEFTNKAGLKLPGTAANGYTVNLKGAYDRNYDADKADQGNIYNNAATAFSVAMLDGNDGVKGAYALGNPEAVGGKLLYKIGEAKPLALTLTPGDVMQYNGAKARIGLRPESAGTARPGDDFILVFTVGYNTRTVDFALADADYVAVYDKKMLWRANLYIDEGTDDWNKVHPWNAPPDGVANANTPSWWSTDWGKNEWNRQYDISTVFENSASVGLKNLKPGNGGQVVTLPSYTPLRDLADKTHVNQLSGTVAYSYPQHRYEPGGSVYNDKQKDDSWANPTLQKYSSNFDSGVPAFSNDWTGDSGSMDSPFDFLWKMKQQKAYIVPAAGEAIAPSNNWWNYVVSSPVLNSFGQIAIGTAMTAPLTINGKLVYTGIRYIPSLGLYLATPGHGTNQAIPASTVSDANDPDQWTASTADIVSNKPDLSSAHKRRNASWIIEAGTDCVGFAQRAASYDGRNYSWVTLPPGMMEYSNGAGTENPYDVINDYGTSTAGWRRFPTEGEGITVIQNTKDSWSAYYKTKGTLSLQEKKLALDALKSVVPGDIWLKMGAGFSDWKTHIAIVAKIPDDPESITDPQTYMDQMILIEGEYTNKIQSVIKKLSVGDYNNNNVTQVKGIYPSFELTLKTLTGKKLNCESWAIRRLKCND